MIRSRIPLAAVALALAACQDGRTGAADSAILAGAAQATPRGFHAGAAIASPLAQDAPGDTIRVRTTIYLGNVPVAVGTLAYGVPGGAPGGGGRPDTAAGGDSGSTGLPGGGTGTSGGGPPPDTAVVALAPACIYRADTHAYVGSNPACPAVDPDTTPLPAPACRVVAEVDAMPQGTNQLLRAVRASDGADVSDAARWFTLTPAVGHFTGQPAQPGRFYGDSVGVFVAQADVGGALCAQKVVLVRERGPA